MEEINIFKAAHEPYSRSEEKYFQGVFEVGKKPLYWERSLNFLIA
jgi:hypothetical protein